MATGAAERGESGASLFEETDGGISTTESNSRLFFEDSMLMLWVLQCMSWRETQEFNREGDGPPSSVETAKKNLPAQKKMDRIS